MNKKWTFMTALLSLMLHDVAPAQQGVSIYSGQFLASQEVKVDAYGPKGTVFTLEKVLDPGAFLRANPKQPQASTARTQVVHRVKLREGGALNFGRQPRGVYVVRAGKVAQVVLVSNLGLVVKRDEQQTLVYTVDRQTGKTVSAQVWRAGSAQAQAADQQGLLHFKTPLPKDQVFLAQYGESWAISGSEWNSYAAPKVRGHVYTDRPVYRPGHKVALKGVLRDGKTSQPLKATGLLVRVLSPQDEEVFRQKLSTDDFGTFNTELELSAGAKLGQYRFEVVGLKQGSFDSEHAEIGGMFQVDAYQKPEYAVTVQPERSRAVQGDKLSVKLSAAYLFGGAVSGAKVNYHVTSGRYDAPGFEDEDMGYAPAYGSELVIQQEARLDERGELTIELPLAKDPDGQPLSYRIEAEVTDESRKSVSGSAQVIAFPAAVNVQTRTDAYAYQAGQAIPVHLETRDLDNKARAAQVKVELIEQRWIKKKGEWTTTETRISQQSAQTGAQGLAQVKLSAPKGGGYLIRSTVKDAQGRRSVSEDFVWVLQAGQEWYWNFRDMVVQLDRKSYKPGDTATVLVGNPKPGAPVLLTLEGQKLRQWQVLRGQGATLSYSFKVTADMSPNLYVAATALSDGQYYSAEKIVKVPRPDAELQVQISADKPKYAPGEQGTFKVQVKDAQGRGVPAELSFGVVDQAIYLIRPDDSPSLLKVFEATRSNVVGTASSQQFYFEQTGPTAAAPREPMSEAAFAQAKAAAKPDASTPRQDFKDTLLWVPHLTTDAQGEAQVQVRYADNLTTWTATARAQTQAPRFGQSTFQTVVTKDVIARLSLPTFLVRGDQATLAGIVNNTVQQPISGQASLNLEKLKPSTTPNLTSGQNFDVPAGGRLRLDQPVTASAAGQAQVTFSAKTTQGNDALKLSFPVKARGYQETRTVVGSGESSATFTLPEEANTASLNIHLTPSLLSAVAPALDYLVAYPYGCTEQTMSRFLPALLARQALGDQLLDRSFDLKSITDLGLARLEQFQHQDGGWNFWEHDDSTLEMSAYVVGGLLRAKQAGVKVNNSMLDRGLKYLAAQVGKEKIGRDEVRPAERAAAYRALAQGGRVKLAQLQAFAQRKELSAYSLAQTALALYQAGDKPGALAALNRLKAKRQTAGELVYWGQSRREQGWYWYWEDNSIQVTAVALEALARLEPQSELIPRITQWLLKNRQGARWVSTQDTAHVIMAALSLPKTTAALPKEVTVQLDGQDLKVVPLNVQKGGSLTLDGAALSKGQHTLSLKGAPAGLTFAAELNYAREPQRLPAVSRGLELQRVYERLIPSWDQKNKRYTYRRMPLEQGGQLGTVKTGDLILVTLRVKAEKAARYLLVSDPIPAGMKALDERSLVITGLQEPDEYAWEDWTYWYAGRDLLDDRVDLYADYLEGRQTMTYLLRAQTPGTFTALPTHAFLMYDPEVEGYSPAATVTVKDR